MTNVTPQQLAKQLRNIGPTCATQLIRVGIDTPEKLRKLGAIKAYMMIISSGGFCGTAHAAYLYALEGAILDCDWRAIPPQKKEEFKQFTASLRHGL